MSRLGALALAALVAGGCATWPTWPLFGAPARILAAADAAAERGEYERALQAYDVYLARYPDDWVAPRVLATRDAVAALVATRAELAKLRRELAERNAELGRVRTDLERIKEIDLKREHPR